ncbi:MAG: hypothetical protein DMG12_01215 [Acidobacteria bacterium]|nr:MAG: hypothetical protein DMG12_01215 [Acidobacteriota bacterium]
MIGLSVAALLTAGALLAQEDGGGRGVARAGPPPPCPPNGYGAQAYYALFGQNGGDGLTAYEIASPCIGKDVREVAESIGMGRSKLLGVKNVIGIQFRADGTMADGIRQPVRVERGAGRARRDGRDEHVERSSAAH